MTDTTNTAPPNRSRAKQKTNQHLKIALTKRALAKQLMRAGAPKREAESVVARLPHRDQWRKLTDAVRSEIAWKSLITPGVES